jgi:arylsulfatase A-like enzyme
MVTQHAPHVPLEATKQYVDRVKHIQNQNLRVYAAMIVALDDCVGALLGKLDEYKLADNTFVAFLSDNGCPPYLPAGTCSNGPFSGFKRYQLEGGIRVPMIFKFPGHLKEGTDYNAPVISLDLTSTVLALGGADAGKPPVLEGVNLMPFLSGNGKGPPHNRFFWRAGANYAVHDGDWKLWVVERPEGGFATFLFNLKADPAEIRNLAAQRPDMVQRLKELYEAWSRSNVPPGYPGRISDVEVNGVMVRLTF